MIFTMDDAYTFCRKIVDSGNCSTTTVYAKINEAVRRLIPSVNTSRMLATIRMNVRNAEFALPREAEKVIAHNANGVPGTVFGRPYQFLHNGPGDFAYNRLLDRSTHQLASLGEHPYMYPIPPLDNGKTGDDEELYPLGFKLYAFSTEESDSGLEMTVRGFGLLSEQLRDGTSVGIPLKINRFFNGTEGRIHGGWNALHNTGDQRFRDIEQVYKPVTAGYVTMYAVYPEDNRMWLVAKYHPDETLPMFTRYRLTSKTYNSTNPSCTNLLMLVKLRYVPLTRATDVIPLDSLDAVKNMVMAIGYEDSRDLQNAMLFEQNALRLLTNEIGQKETTASPPMVMDVTRELSGRYCRSRQGFQ